MSGGWGLLETLNRGVPAVDPLGAGRGCDGDDIGHLLGGIQPLNGRADDCWLAVAPELHDFNSLTCR